MGASLSFGFTAALTASRGMEPSERLLHPRRGWEALGRRIGDAEPSDY